MASPGLSGSYTYKATDGTRAKIDFAEKDKTVTIEANGKKFQLDQVNLQPTGTEYERNGIKASVKGDSVTITQGNNVIELVRDL